MCCAMYYPLMYVVHYVFFSYLWFLVVCSLFVLAFTKSVLTLPILHLIRPKGSTQSHANAFQNTVFLSDIIMTSHPSMNIKIQSLNVKGLGKPIKRRSIFRWLYNQRYQFAFLQETHSTKECAQFWEAESRLFKQ